MELYAGKCRLDGDTLVVKGLSYTVENLEKLPEDLNSFNIMSRSMDHLIAFFGELNPLSNFHQCKFTVDGVTFHSSEQYIQYVKALYFKDRSTGNEILSASTSLHCKQLSKNIASYNHSDWSNKAKELCLPGIKSKFEQNPYLMDVLKSTGEKQIIEASYDTLWGTGVLLNSRDCLIKCKWECPGILGEILMDI